eukprot:scaffold926_cov248-Pinguiococcus_pyrenoidosus.AAC.20
MVKKCAASHLLNVKVSRLSKAAEVLRAAPLSPAGPKAFAAEIDQNREQNGEHPRSERGEQNQQDGTRSTSPVERLNRATPPLPHAL